MFVEWSNNVCLDLLVRVPVASHGAMRTVCHRFNDLVGSPAFRKRRIELQRGLQYGDVAPLTPLTSGSFPEPLTAVADEDPQGWSDETGGWFGTLRDEALRLG